MATKTKPKTYYGVTPPKKKPKRKKKPIDKSTDGKKPKVQFRALVSIYEIDLSETIIRIKRIPEK